MHGVVLDGQTVVQASPPSITVLPQQRELHSFRKPNDWEWGLVSASSYHPGGVHILMGDAAVMFITDALTPVT